jgi:DNA-binding GntR family transcriptional regulator
MPHASSTVDLLAQRLREDILSGELAPGQAIPQEEIAARLGVSRSPLREALRRLEAEGLVHYRTNRGAVVATLDPRSVRELFEMRRILEVGAIELVVKRIDAPRLTALRRLDAALAKVREPRAFVLAHRQFHELLYEAAGNPLLVKAVIANSVRVARVPEMHRAVAAIMKCARADHAELLEALARRDLRGARQATREHLAHIEAATLGALEPVEA